MGTEAMYVNNIYAMVVCIATAFAVVTYSSLGQRTEKCNTCKHIEECSTWASMVKKWSTSCSDNTVMERENNLYKRRSILPPGVKSVRGGRYILEWSLSSSMDNEGMPVCNSTTSLLEGLRKGHRNKKSVFVPYKCKPMFFNPDEACKVASKYSHVHFVGDSLSRHWLQGLQMLLRGDLVMGGLPLVGKHNSRQLCRCDGQFSEHEVCKVSGRSLRVDDPWNHGMCYASKTFSYSFVNYRGNIDEQINSSCTGDSRPRLFILQGGAHFRSNASTTIAAIIDPAITIIKNNAVKCNNTYPVRIIWSGLNTQDIALDTKYPHQSRENAIIFNTVTETYIMTHYNVESLNFINMTTRAPVSDGYHYLSDVNTMKAMYLLNIMALGMRAPTIGDKIP